MFARPGSAFGSINHNVVLGFEYQCDALASGGSFDQVVDYELLVQQLLICREYLLLEVRVGIDWGYGKHVLAGWPVPFLTRRTICIGVLTSNGRDHPN